MSRHLKTYPAPKFWPIRIKEREFTVKPSAGPHPLVRSIPLGIVIRDMLRYAETISEVKKVLSEGKVLVDGKARKDHKFPVGLMDVVTLVPTNEHYRVMPDKVNKLTLVRIAPEEAAFKLARIASKRILKGSRVQLCLHDGRSVSVKVDDPFNMELGYRTFDTVKISIPQGEILEAIPLETGAFVSITGGTNIGKYGTLLETPEKRDPNQLAAVRIGETESTVTLKYLFPVGKESPVISISGVV